MLRYVQDLWSAFFPTEAVFPLQVVGRSGAAVESREELEKALTDTFLIFTYRDGFEAIPAVTRLIETDQGWGCLLRTSQMLLAHFLWVHGRPADRRLSLFFDHSAETAPFSIHNMIRSLWNRRAFKAEYWSPSQGCEAIKRTVQGAVKTEQLQTRVMVVTSTNGCIYADEVQHTFKQGADVVLVLASVRVSAAAQLTQESYLQIEKLMEQPQCLGVVGGVPGRSYYFFAHNQTQLFYLDPHQRTAAALLSEGPSAAVSVTPSVADVRCVHWSRVDTSLFLAFAVTTRDEWAALEVHLSNRFMHVESQRTQRDCDQLSRARPGHADGTFLSPLQTGDNCGMGGTSISEVAPLAHRRTLRVPRKRFKEGEVGTATAAKAERNDGEDEVDTDSWEYLD
ncbi:AUT2/APG4/ATG4 cysteine peptidase / ATG4.2 [Leishmania donovani]|uniref:Cysteine protease n=3 Tax=Leishmania donovani species complex TaxID=38574 RepID=A0A6L0XU79_LEIIN|nr:putative AUT2/APG4/ATG4 cysteine peptidase [Leishmania infantum JPCM5]TPP43477.1 Peptidase C54 family protein [Leishmania donovani]CAC9511705.1 AUT2/APG4/ATG4_cysteine_peptidase_-_putative [Leishmania infantum]CAJ1990810.1 AUT2/APG4/ATG4 cysteine peptidase / ATG4.2 [Leishmania donovani]CAM69889.1 putative AUT2/APG4/ATG4 cysteine peptidase [Leishmania infantum JPCM5]SUZ43840.1 AUT2/APG4/ATG4_cysteine_peptidase_-_putative [Leishmania infantum]|eukprot:XP_001466840.1 putative AUT2/APG4/ATG4 cysteine peptidase [Leishmania infantum JPCM5]